MSGSDSLTNLKREIKRLGIVSGEKIKLLSYFTGNENRRVDALSCLDDVDTEDEKCTYLRSLISTSDILPPSCYQTPPQVIVENSVSIVQKSLPFQNEDAEVIVNPSTSRSIPKDTYLPENACQLLRYYELWNKPYDKWPSLHEFSEHLHDVKKDRAHDSFKKEIEVLKQLFSEDHPAQLRLAHLEGQLKLLLVGELFACRLALCLVSGWILVYILVQHPRGIFVSDCTLANKSLEIIQQTPRTMKKIRRIKVAQLTKLLTKKDVVKEEIEIAQDSVVLGGYRRISQHYNDFHEASTRLVKRHLSDGNDEDLKDKEDVGNCCPAFSVRKKQCLVCQERNREELEKLSWKNMSKEERLLAFIYEMLTEVMEIDSNLSEVIPQNQPSTIL
ncbi:16059_t:CDS:2 [Funneliformis mosseae]|uniref:16059_t:CDS:1 n=1 Tax=Funneliformis mosseae TaxID=27381 RepID=A0A9N9E2T3_FUNMO|nr:16059_t:CDS:2 [Funneliformis mosseae]